MKLSRFIPVALLMALFSCKKNDDKPATSEPVYYPATITMSTSADSVSLKYTFFYDKGGSLTTLVAAASTAAKADTFHFVRNAKGDCIRVTSRSDDDSIVYRGNTVIIYSVDSYGFYGDSTLFTCNNLGDIILFGSKDTVRSGSMKIVHYNEFTLVNGNPETVTTHEYFASGDAQGSANEYVLKYTYDDKPSGMQALLRAEPLLAYYMNYSISYISLGQNNLTSIQQSGYQMNFTNTYDDVTGYLSTQSTAIETTSLSIAYTYIKVK